MENTDTGVSHTSLTENDLYDGNLSSLPSSTAGLVKLSVAHLRAILRAHSVLEIGTKEELLARVGLLKAGYPEAAFSRERLCILHMIVVAKQIAEIQEDRLAYSIRRIRAFAHGNSSTMTTRKACLKSVLTKQTPTIQATIPKRKVDAVLHSLEKAFAQYEERSRAAVDDLEKTSTVKESKRKADISGGCKAQGLSNDNVRRSERKRKVPAKLMEQMTTNTNGRTVSVSVGEQVQVLWSEKDLSGTSWKPGWYHGEIQSYDEDNDVVYIWYYEDQAVYGLDASSALADQIIRPVP